MKILEEQKCPNCGEYMSSPYTFKDSKGVWHEAHKNCCGELQMKIEKQMGKRK